MVLIVLASGLLIRLYDLTDLPLEFHPTRQLFSAIKARGLYYAAWPEAPAEQHRFAIQQAKLRPTIEPEILERLAALTWQVTGEQLWVPRLYSTLCWLIGGLFLYLLSRDLFGRAPPASASSGSAGPEAPLFTLAFYLLLPYGVLASRSFQPDSLMLMLTIGFWWAVHRWAQAAFADSAGVDRRASRRYALLAALLGGLAIFVKLPAAFFVIGGGLGAALGWTSLRSLIRHPQLWMMAILGALPGAAWVIYGLSRGFLGQQFGGRFLPALFLSPSMYLGWAQMLHNVLGLVAVPLALAGLLTIQRLSARALLLGLWGSYLAFAVFFNYHVSTHDYYNLPLIPIAALSLTPLGEAILDRLADCASRSRLNRLLVASLLTLSLLAGLWTIRSTLKSTDYRPQADFWRQVGDLVRGRRVVALTQDYGLPLIYWGWAYATNWPDSTDQAHSAVRGQGKTFDELFERLASNKELFLVTDLADLARQPKLQERLAGYAVFAQGPGFVIYDLTRPLPASP